MAEVAPGSSREDADAEPSTAASPGRYGRSRHLRARPRRRRAATALAIGAAVVLAAAVVHVQRDSDATPGTVATIDAGGTPGQAASPGVVASGDGFWVSPEGDDAAAGSTAQPWRTIAHAVATAATGARILVRGGTYQPFAVERAGLTITSAPGERATIEGRVGVRDVVLVAADNVTVTDLTVAGCVPKASPDVNVHGDHGSGIRVHRTTGVVIRGVTVRDSHGVNAAGLPVGCYGILATESRDLLVASSEVYHNGAGIDISGGGRGIVIEDNNVHDQDVILQNSRQSLDDFGGHGLGAKAVTDKPGPVFRRNTVVRNFGPSTDYGIDGGGAEIYDAANTTFTANTFSDNDGVVETGTGSRGRCADNVFSDNTVTGRATAPGLTGSIGLVLRCASNMAITNNTFTNLDEFAILVESGGAFGGAVNGLRVESNTVTQRKGAVVFRLQFGSGPIPPMSVDRNRYRTAQDGFAVLGSGPSETTVSFSTWQARTGFDARSAQL